jgi:DNA polymerase-4
LDEAFLDVTSSIRLFGSPAEIAKKIKQQVLEGTGLTVSAGVGPSKFVAKIASDLQKPDGLVVVPRGGVKEFLDPLPIERLWGVGRATRKTLSRHGVHTIGDLSRFPLEVLEKRLGRQGLHLHLLANGVDHREVEPDREVKSIGHEETYPEDIRDLVVAKKGILQLSTKVARRLRGHGLSGRTISLKVKYEDFVQVTRSVTLPKATNDGRKIFQTCCSLLEKTDVGKRPVRLLGISLSQFGVLEEERQLTLFTAEKTSHRRKRLNQALDSISEKFGEEAILPGTLLDS